MHPSPCSMLSTLPQTFQLIPGLSLHLSHSHLTQNLIYFLFWPWFHFLASGFLSPSQLINSEMASWVTISLVQLDPGNMFSLLYSTFTSHSVYPRTMCKTGKKLGILLKLCWLGFNGFKHTLVHLKSKWKPFSCNPMEYTVHDILQTRLLEWVAFPFSRGSFQPRDWSQVSCTAGRFFTS